MSEDTEDVGNEIHKIEHDGKTLVIMNEKDQFIVADKMTIKEGKNAGKTNLTRKGYFTSMRGANECSIRRLSKQDAKSLEPYLKSLNKWTAHFESSFGLLEPKKQ
jgi:hypothetical protein